MKGDNIAEIKSLWLRCVRKYNMALTSSQQCDEKKKKEIFTNYLQHF